uniref:Desmoglein-2-like n=1 Tax=Gouania willdenowi TaxID=441366 RepID=A0A8C5E0E4_GOUWI
MRLATSASRQTQKPTRNKPEGPHFAPNVKAIPMKEGENSINIKDVLVRYPAIDGDTLELAENVRYVKGFDPDNWLTIDPKTAEIKLNKMPDRESPALVNGTYFAEIICISEDLPSQTATGTVAIQVADSNDHCPIITSDFKILCTTQNAIIVQAHDRDADPNGAPFDFILVGEGTGGEWEVEHLNDTAAIVRAQESLWPGFYQVEFMVRDQQGEACPEPQKVKVKVCTCEDGVICGKSGTNVQSKETHLGPAFIGVLLLGLLMLLVIPLLLLSCQCGGPAKFPDIFTEMPFDTKSHLINYHTEHPGVNTEVPLMNIPTQVEEDALLMGSANHVLAVASAEGFGFQQSSMSLSGWKKEAFQNAFSSNHRENMWEMTQQNGSGFNTESKRRQTQQTSAMFDNMALPYHFLGEYYSQEISGKNLGVKDELLMYDYEGKDSSASSVGCCSLLEIDDDLHFLDDLGVKFKTIAEVCGGKKIQNEAKPVLPPLPSVPSSSAQTLASTLASPQQMPPPPLQQSRTQETVIRETSNVREKVERNAATVREGTTVKTQLANQNQMILLPQQQPIYYTTAPMLQPVHYVVQPQVQSTVLLAEAPATNVHNMVLVQDAQAVPSQGVIVQAPTTISSGHAQGHGMVLVGTGEVPGVNVVNKGNYSGHQTMMVVEGKVPAGSTKVLKGNQTHFVPGGTLQHGGMSGSQTLLLVGEQTGSGGRLLREAGGLSQRSEVSGTHRAVTGRSSTLISSKSRKTSSSTRGSSCSN